MISLERQADNREVMEEIMAEFNAEFKVDGNIRIITKVLGSVSTNCYFVINELTKETILIDPADNFATIESVILENGLLPKAVLLTHGHFDHILAAAQVREKYKLPIIACKQERKVLEDSEYNLSSSFGRAFAINADQYEEDAKILELAGFMIKLIHTPGHTEGGACYYFMNESVLFSGDTLFLESVGRTDFPSGSMSKIVRSIKEKLLVLPENTIVYPGHGEKTSIEYEKMNNPYCQ